MILSQVVKRYNNLYPKLLKKQIKSKIKQSAINKEDLAKKIDEQLTLNNDTQNQEHLSLISKLAKTEIDTLLDSDEQSQIQNTLKSELTSELQSLIAAEKSEDLFNSHQTFIFCLFIHLSRKVETSNLFHLYKIMYDRLQKYVSHFPQKQTNVQDEGENTLENAAEQKQIESFEKDQVIKQCLDMIRVIVKYICKQSDQQVLEAVLKDIIQGLAVLSQTNRIDDQSESIIGQQQIMPYAVQFLIINQILENKHFKQQTAMNFFTQIFQSSIGLLQVIKLNSQQTIVNHESSWKKQGSGNKEIKRQEGLAAEIQNLLIKFNSVYFNAFKDILDPQILSNQCQSIFQIFFQDDDEGLEQGENFILSERLGIINNLNEIFINMPSIQKNKVYWKLIQRGLCDLDIYCRKMALTILHQNIATSNLDAILKESGMTQKQFDSIWTTYFDVYDTLDSFSSHLTKAMWDRTELFYTHLKEQQGVPSHPLVDFKIWLQVLNTRALTHENQNIRKYIQKELLSREYFTSHMSEFIFSEFLIQLNDGLLLRDFYMIFTQFSKNNELIIKFYTNYMTKESKDIVTDYQKLLTCLTNHIDHPQMIVSILKVLSTNIPNAVTKLIGLNELKQFAKIVDTFQYNMVFSNRYLCYKYILMSITYYLDVDQFNQSQEMQFLLLKILGLMPFELFSASDSIIYTDREGLECAATLVNQIGFQNLQGIVQGYFSDIFQVKANLQAIPKFQGQSANIQNIIKGLVKVLLIIDTKFENDGAIWFHNMMQPNLDVFYGQILTSSYVSPEVIDQKISCFTHIYSDLLKFSSTQQHRDTLIHQTKMGAHLVLERIENCILVPLSLYERKDVGSTKIITGFQDKTKLASAFSHLSAYTKYLDMLVRVFHIYVTKTQGLTNQTTTSDSIVEKMIKLLLSQSLKLSQIKKDEITLLSENANHEKGSQTVNIGLFLWQYVVFEFVYSMLSAYSTGIQENIKRGIDNLLVPDDIFTMGKSICINLVEFKPIRYDQKSFSLNKRDQNQQEDFVQIEKMIIDCNLVVRKVQNDIDFNNWAIIGQFLQLFRFDPELQQQAQLILYPQISIRAKEYLNENMNSDFNSEARAKGSNWTYEEGLYNYVIFSLLKTTFLPVITQEIAKEGDKKAIKQYFDVCWKCWNSIKSIKGVFELKALQEFLEIAFDEQILEVFLSLKQQKINETMIKKFFEEMAKEIFETGNQFWLILRSTFNHIMLIIQKKPYLMGLGFENFLVNFSLSREIRSLDSEIHLYRIETLIPEIVPKKYENLSMEQISYQGAYIRCMSMFGIESIIKNVLTQINCSTPQNVYQNFHIQSVLENLELCFVQLFKANSKVAKNSQSEMPYSQEHREKLRIWQSLIVMTQLLDPSIYTPEFRQVREQISGFNIVNEIDKELWITIKQSHIPSIRQYIEVFTIRFCLNFPKETIGTPKFMETLLNANVKPQTSSSFITIAGYCMTHAQASEDSETTHLKNRVFEAMVGFCTANSAHARCMAHYFVRLMYDDPIFRAFIPQGLEQIRVYFENAKDVKKILKKYDEQVQLLGSMIQNCSMDTILSIQIDAFGEFIHKPFTETIKTITQEVMSEHRNAEHFTGKRDNFWQKELEYRQQKGELNVQISSTAQSSNRPEGQSAAEFDQVQNYQRKVLPWEQIELEKNKFKRLFENRQRNEVIMCASLIDKAPNLAGLTRTCEIMNAQALVIGNKDVVRTEEFKTIAVTAEKWLPIYEVKPQQILEYLQYQKTNGYKILGLEQTANSKMLEDYQFPKKCILLLGKEKEGIPQEYLGVLDECIEIPQFGIVRSLNVHVSGALCLWEYTKQQIQANKLNQ